MSKLSSQSCTGARKPLQGSQRLRDIEYALSQVGRPAVSSQSCPQSQSQFPRPFTAGRAKRMKDIEDALSQVSQISPPTVQPEAKSLKRTSCSSPEPSPMPKRRQLSPETDSPALSPLSSPTNSIIPFSGSLSDSHVTPTTTPEPMNSSPSPNAMGSSLQEEILSQDSPRHSMLPANSSSHLEAFFSQYPAYTFDPSAPSTTQFHRMCDVVGLNSDHTKRKAARSAFNDALSRAFNHIYGTEVGNLESWQILCRVVQMDEIPDNLEECQEAFLSANVNLVDLVDYPNTSKPIVMFKSERDLSKYTLSSKKIFPRSSAYAGGLLKYLLRQIFNPPPPDSTPRKRYRAR